jgi:uncharacterized protein (DUF983 family)
MAKRSVLAAMVEERCPRCRQGKMFKHGAYHLSKFDEMYEHCPVCGFRYEIELGFFWGAMYMSYGLSVGIVALVGVGLYFLANDPPMWVYLVAVSGITLLLTPWMFRFARVMMLYFFGSVSYDPKYDPEANK